MREIILQVVNCHQGLRAVELALKVMEIVNPSTFDKTEFEWQLMLLIREGEIVEVNYILPQMEYRLKSIYFPKGTIFHVQDNFRSNTGRDSV